MVGTRRKIVSPNTLSLRYALWRMTVLSSHVTEASPVTDLEGKG